MPEIPSWYNKGVGFGPSGFTSKYEQDTERADPAFNNTPPGYEQYVRERRREYGMSEEGGTPVGFEGWLGQWQPTTAGTDRSELQAARGLAGQSRADQMAAQAMLQARAAGETSEAEQQAIANIAAQQAAARSDLATYGYDPTLAGDVTERVAAAPGEQQAALDVARRAEQAAAAQAAMQAALAAQKGDIGMLGAEGDIWQQAQMQDVADHALRARLAELALDQYFGDETYKQNLESGSYAPSTMGQDIMLGSLQLASAGMSAAANRGGGGGGDQGGEAWDEAAKRAYGYDPNNPNWSV